MTFICWKIMKNNTWISFILFLIAYFRPYNIHLSSTALYYILGYLIYQILQNHGKGPRSFVVFHMCHHFVCPSNCPLAEWWISFELRTQLYIIYWRLPSPFLPLLKYRFFNANLQPIDRFHFDFDHHWHDKSCPFSGAWLTLCFTWSLSSFSGYCYFNLLLAAENKEFLILIHKLINKHDP